MLRKLFIIALCLVATTFTTQAQTQTPPDNEIWYTTIDGEIAELEYGEWHAPENGEDFEIVSHTYENGSGVIRANKPIKAYGDWDSGGFRVRGNIESVILPKGLTIIGSCAFYGCSSLTSITIPDSVTSIGDYAFAGCSSLTSITIPDSVTSIEWNAFRDCSGLKSVKVANKYCYDYFKKLGISDITFIVSTLEEYEEAQKLGATKLAIDSNSKYASEDGLCLIDNGKLILFIGKDLTEYTIPESVTSIGEEAFYGCSSLKSITIPDSVTYIGESVFEDCSSLTSITIPNSVTSIEYGAFAECSSLTSITIPESVTSIGNCAFQGCSSLTSVTIPDSITSIGWGAFLGCSSLTSITIPNSVTSIGEYAFYGCDSLTSITIPNSVTTIGEETFYNCSSLTSITIPESVTLIGERAFYCCSSLTSITIPDSVTGIGEWAFYDCSSLIAIKCLTTTPPTIIDWAISETTLIYVPKEAIKAYKKDPNWSKHKKQIKPIK